MTYSTHGVPECFFIRRIVQINAAAVFKQEFYFSKRVVFARALLKLILKVIRCNLCPVNGFRVSYLSAIFKYIDVFIGKIEAVFSCFNNDFFGSYATRNVPYWI